MRPGRSGTCLRAAALNRSQRQMPEIALVGSRFSVEVVGLSKRFPRWRGQPKDALRGVSFSLREGEVLAVIGPNGSGKSTLLRILSGLLLPTTGGARVAGKDVVADRPKSRAAIGFAAADDRGLSPRLSIRENVRFFGALHGLTGKQTRERTAELAERLECTEWLDRPVRTLSSGERARGALIRALIHQPKVLLVDELTRSLDPGAGSRIRAWLRSQSLSVVMASHDLTEVETTAHRVVLLDKGAIAAQGTWNEVRDAAQAVYAR